MNDKIRVIRPALIASLIGFALKFSTEKIPHGSSDGAGHFVQSVMVGIVTSVVAFLIVFAWQGARRYFTKPSAGQALIKTKPGIFTAIASKDDALAAIKIFGWSIVIMSGISSVIRLSIVKNWMGMADAVLFISLTLIVIRLKSRVAAVGLLLCSVGNALAVGYYRFSGSDGGSNLFMALCIVWASARLVSATFRLQSSQEPETMPNIPNENQDPVRSDTDPQESIEDTPLLPSQSLLASCHSCGYNFSKRTLTCPKCNAYRADQLAACHICQKQIPGNATSCPECGDSNPFESEGQILPTVVVQEGPYTKGRFVKILIKVLKVVGILFLIFLVALGAFLAYQYYEDKKHEEEELGFDTSLKWNWHPDSYDTKIQIHTPEGGGRSILRKVNLQKKSAIYAYKNDDYSITTIATFKAECQPEKEIVTSKSFSNGEPMKLACNKDGNQLSISVSWPRKDNDFSWQEDLDGFSIYEGFKFWNFRKLDQEVTLSKQLSNPKSAGGAEEGSIHPKTSTSIPGDVEPEWTNQSNKLFEKKDWPGLLNHALSRTKAQPEDANAWTTLGLAYNETKQTDKSIEAYQQAVRINPESSLAWHPLGLAYEESNQLVKAIEADQQAIRINPGNAVTWNNLGVAYGRSNLPVKAIEAYQQAVHIDPKYANAWNRLGVVYEETKQYAKAIEAYQQAVRINPEHTNAWNNLGGVYSSTKQYAKAIEAFEQVVRIDPEMSEAWADLGVAYGNSNQTDKAIKAFQQATRINPEIAHAWFLYGLAYGNSYQPGKTFEAYQQEISIAVDTVFTFPKTTGMAGLAEEIQDCYEKQDNTSYCFYLDIASRQLDQIVCETMHFPPAEFFTEEKVRERIEPGFTKLNMDKNTANQYIADTTLAIKRLLEKGIIDNKL